MAIKAERFKSSVNQILGEHYAGIREDEAKAANVSEILGELYEASELKAEKIAKEQGRDEYAKRHNLQYDKDRDKYLKISADKKTIEYAVDKATIDSLIDLELIHDHDDVVYEKDMKGNITSTPKTVFGFDEYPEYKNYNWEYRSQQRKARNLEKEALKSLDKFDVNTFNAPPNATNDELENWEEEYFIARSGRDPFDYEPYEVRHFLNKLHENEAKAEGITGPEDDKYFAIINGERSHVNRYEKHLVMKYGKTAADYIHKFTEREGKIIINKDTGLNQYGFFQALGSGFKAIPQMFSQGLQGFGKMTGLGVLPFKSMLNMGQTAFGKASFGLSKTGSQMFGKGGFFGKGGAASGIMSGIGAAAPALGIAQTVLGSFSAAKANKKLAKDLKRQMKMQTKVQGDLTGETAEALDTLQDRTILQEQALGESVSEGYEDILAAQGAMQSKTGGLNTGTIEMQKSDALKDLQTSWSQQLTQLDQGYEDSMKGIIDSVEDQQFQFSENMKQMMKARKQARKKSKWYKNLI